MTLRARLLAYLSLAAIASCTLTVGFGVVLVRHHIADQRFTQLHNEAALLAVRPEALRAGDHVYRVDFHPVRPAHPAFTAAVVSAIGSAGSGQGTIHVHRRTLIYVSLSTPSGRIIAVRRAALRFADWRPFLEALVLAGLAGALLAVVLGFVLARRLTRPIDSLAVATARLAEGEAGVVVPVSGGDELADLGRSFNAMSTELARTRDDQRAFLESVSHELKTPLTSVRGYSEALAEEAIGPQEAGRVIAAEAGRLQRLVADLLDLARLGRSDFAVECEPVDLAAVGATAVTRHQVRARDLGVTLVHDARDPPGTTESPALGDDGRLLQACSNLIENALRLTPPGGTVTVATGDHGVSVCDDGPGLDEADLKRAFERFYLYDRYRADPGRAVGSGLGLAIVAQLVAAMGGTVRAANRPEGGACFQIGLPAAPTPSMSPRDRSPTPRPPAR